MRAYLDALIRCGLDRGLIRPGDETYVLNFRPQGGVLVEEA